MKRNISLIICLVLIIAMIPFSALAADPSREPSGNPNQGAPGGVEKPYDPNTPLYPYDDIKGHWGESYIKKVFDRGLMLGISSHEFAPDRPITKASVVTILYRNVGSPIIVDPVKYVDVNESHWFFRAVSWATRYDLLKGLDTANAFYPDANITRLELAQLFYNYSKAYGFYTTAKNTDPIAWAIEIGMFLGRGDGDYAPDATSTRAEMATMLTRFFR